MYQRGWVAYRQARQVLNNPRSEVRGIGKGNADPAEGQQPLTLSQGSDICHSLGHGTV